MMIVVELQGGLGNQMFQYALGRHLSLLHKAPLYLDTAFLSDRSPRQNFTYRDFSLDIFNIEAAIISKKNIKKYDQHQPRWKKIVNRLLHPSALEFIGENKFSFSPSVLQLPSKVYLNGYWQSEKYFKAIAPIIRQDFTIKEALPLAVTEWQRALERQNAVCLHVRRGDFVQVPLHGTLGMEYYGKAAALIAEKVTDPIFYIFSDDIHWCKKNIELAYPTVFMDEALAAEKARGHFWLMCHCKHFIIPNSSFAWWAAWLGEHPDKIVVAPKTWWHNPNIETQDILPPHWLTL